MIKLVALCDRYLGGGRNRRRKRDEEMRRHANHMIPYCLKSACSASLSSPSSSEIMSTIPVRFANRSPWLWYASTAGTPAFSNSMAA